MAIVKQFWLATCIVALAACAESAPNPIQAATTCIRQRVPEGTTAPVVKAQKVVKDCEYLLDEWSRFSVEGTHGKPFDASDKEMMSAFNKHQEAARRFWLKILAPEYARAHPDYD